MSENGNDGIRDRLDRLEKAMELLINDHLAFRDEHKALLRSQVLLTDAVQKLAEAQLRTDEALRRTDEALRRTDEKLNILITTVDDLIRRTPRPPKNPPTQ